jgi:hypothetical protein
MKSLKSKPIELPDIPWKMTRGEKKRHRELGKQIGSPFVRTVRLHHRLQEYRESAWFETVHAFEANPGDFYNAWHYLNNHPVFWTFGEPRDGTVPEVHERNLQHEYGMLFGNGIEVTVHRVDPKTRSVSDDPARNTRTEVWYELSLTHWPTHEHYPHRIHDYEGDGGAKTYEKAIVKAARKVHELYGNDRRILDAQLNKEPEPENACHCPAHQKSRETLIEAAPGWTGCQECYSFGCNAAVCNCACHPKEEQAKTEPTLAEALAELGPSQVLPVAELAKTVGCGRPSLTQITVETRRPGKWRFVDTETQQVWRWRDGAFELVDPIADTQELTDADLLADPELQESIAQCQHGETVPATTLAEEEADWQARAEKAEASLARVRGLLPEFRGRSGYAPTYSVALGLIEAALAQETS